MIKAGIVGLGWWGKTLVEGVQGGSSEIQFVAGAARTHTDELKAFAKDNKFELYSTFEDMLNHKGLDAVVLATPHSLHVPQVVQRERLLAEHVLTGRLQLQQLLQRGNLPRCLGCRRRSFRHEAGRCRRTVIPTADFS